MPNFHVHGHIFGRERAKVLSCVRKPFLWFFQSLAVVYTVPGILVRQRATSLLLYYVHVCVLHSCTGLRLCSAAFCILKLSVTLLLTRALSENLGEMLLH